jgi:phosphoglycerate dehydrogenase-like enzyme
VGLGLKVLAYDPFPNREFAQQWKVEYADFDTVLSRSDIVSLHLPMCPENIKLMNRERFAKMKRGSYLINTARGPLVDEDALCEALRTGHLAGAGLDVFQKEPLPLDSPLLAFDNVLLSSHVGGMDIECNYDIAVKFAETVLALHRGEWPTDCIQNLKGCKSWKW